MSTDQKTIINMLYHAGVDAALMVVYAEIGKKIFKKQTPRVDFNIMLPIDVLLATATKEVLIKQGIIPADISK